VGHLKKWPIMVLSQVKGMIGPERCNEI
jgi:hypothetical protein